MIRILLVDDQPAVRQGLRMRLALEPDVVVVGEAEDGLAALAMAATLRPDVIIMDIEMPGLDGLTCTDQLRAAMPESAVVVLSMYDNAATRKRAVEVGATTFVSKHEAAQILPAAIRQAAQSGGTGRARAR
jgi:DNA-binding NarL/FixJ family response regulator